MSSNFENTSLHSLWRILVLTTLTCAAVIVPTEGQTSQGSPGGDTRETIIKALRGLQAQKSFRMHQLWSGAERHATVVLEVVKPDRSHIIQNDNEETIFIGDKGYGKGGGPWMRLTDRMTEEFTRAQSDINVQIKSIGQVKFIGADTLDGVSVLGYEYEYIEASGKSSSGPYKIWIGKKDGLPYRTESETQCRGEDWGGKPGDSGLIPIKVVTTYYDYNGDIIIELPERAAREAAEHWLKLVDSGRYADSWAEASSDFKQRYSEEAWKRLLNGSAEQASALGPIKSRELMSLQSLELAKWDQDHTRDLVLLTYRSQLEKLDPRSQRLELVLDTDQVWRVFDYNGGMGRGSGGLGGGDGGGMRPGRVRGVLRGNGYSMGGGDPRLGGGSEGPATSVVTKPIQLNSPQPRYTEEARNNKIEGNVTMRVLVGDDGQVKQARIVRGLPGGLNEQAIQAAYQLRFKPAVKGGVPVAYWMPVLVEFNLGRK